MVRFHFHELFNDNTHDIPLRLNRSWLGLQLRGSKKNYFIGNKFQLKKGHLGLATSEITSLTLYSPSLKK